VSDWLIYRGDGNLRYDLAARLPKPPPWREFDGRPLVEPVADDGDASQSRRLAELVRATTYRSSPEEVEQVNAALYLRRPLLITGKPGTGKSTLAYSVAHELQLGRVLSWPITSRSTREEGLYQ
jgi:MoxR-like ATPase